MKNHTAYTDQEFEKLFATVKIDASLFTHEAHLRLAWIHIRKYGVDTAIANIRKQLKAFVSHLGEEDKYHDTLTIAAIRAVHHFMLLTDHESFDDFISDQHQLQYKFKELIESHYSFNIFTSPEARSRFIAPDLAPFD